VTTNPCPEFWHGKRVLLTGHTGFKGAWLEFWLTRLDAKVTGIALDSQVETNLYTALGRVTEQEFFVDIRNNAGTRKAVHSANPDAVRPWQPVLEALACYLLLAEKLWSDPQLVGSYNFGPNVTDTASVKTIVSKVSKLFNGSQFIVESSDKEVHESDWLMLDTAKVRNVLGSLDDAIVHTILWYQQQLSGADASALCESDIAMYEKTPYVVCDPHA